MTERRARILALYDAALKQPPAERSAFVAAHAANDADLKRRVEALLAGQEDTRLSEHADTALATGASIAPGTRIGSYLLDAPLGAGGMGMVYRATDTKLNRPAAIKVLPADLATPEARRRFQREAQMVSSLNHPHIVTVYDAGEYLDRQYLITELVDGGTLRQWAARPHSWRQIVELLVGVADGIATAHDAGILHRDIKPENILLAKNGYAKLADFGIAKLVEAEDLPHEPLPDGATDHSTLIGTVAYMSPEQAQGLPLDARSDVFAFGIVLYELLAGRRPFDLEDARLPHERSPAPKLGAEVPTELRSIVAKALELDPADRYQTMRDLVVDLRHLARRSGVDTEGLERRGKRVRPWLVYALAGVAALVAAVAIVREYARDVASDAPTNAVAVLPFDNESTNGEDLHISEGLGDDLRGELAKLPALRVRARVSSTAFRDRATDPATIAARLGAGRLVTGSLRRRGEMLNVGVEILDGTGTVIWSEGYARPERELLALEQQLASDVMAQLVPEADVPSATAQRSAQASAAHLLFLLGQLNENQVNDELIVDEPKLASAISYYRQAIAADPMYEPAYSRLASALVWRGGEADLDDAQRALSKAFELGESSWSYYTLALYIARRGLTGIEAAYRRAIELDSSNADALRVYAEWIWGKKNVGEADVYYRRAIEADPESLRQYGGYVEYLGGLGERDKALALAEAIRARFDNARGYRLLARLYELVGDVDLAIAWALQAYALDPADLDTAWQLAELYTEIGDFKSAQSFEPEPGVGQLFLQQRYPEVIEYGENLLFDQPEDLKTRYLVAFAYNTRDEFENTKGSLQLVNLAQRATSESAQSVDTQASTTLADALRATGEDDEADTLAAFLVKTWELHVNSGGQKSVWALVQLACAYANLGRDSNALATLERIDPRLGLPRVPLLEDSVCFRRLAASPRYRAVVEAAKARQGQLRERLPTTLREHASSSRTNVGR